LTDGEALAVMLKPFIVAAVVAVSATISKAEEPPKQYVEAITIEEFTKLPFDSQVMYVAGMIDGFTYVMRNYDIAGYDQYSACVRGVSLEVATKDMLRQLKERKEEEPLGTYFAKSLGARCHHN
jgi:hypothetical protein